MPASANLKHDPPPPFRLDVQLHELLMRPPQARPMAAPLRNGREQLPVPPFPSRPELQAGEDAEYLPTNGRRKWKPKQILHTMNGWMFPYFKSRLLPGDFHPIISYLFTEWKCNLDCHYCWAFENSVKGMTEDVAKRSIEWLHSTTCRVLALMGGEPLLRPDFAHKVVYYAAKKGFWVYLPTNGRLLRPEVIDKLGDAGVDVFNLAVDAVDVKPGLPKALAPIRPYFEYLLKKQYRYGYSIFLNICICRNNMDDVRMLTEIAHDNGIATDYHIVESPMTEQPHYKHLNENPTFVREEDWPEVDELLQWLIEKQKAGYKMTNSCSRIAEMGLHMRGKLQEWNCRAGQNTLIIRTDGTLAPCFPMYSANYDWGAIEDHKFEVKQLDAMKQDCQKHCFSTLNHIVGFCYNDARVIKWLLKQAARGFQGVTNWND
ncbi:MAG TPA: radical SAM protein [Terriglobales bacterium]|nr:radical SAM protein [Terriglobales bacterium]